MFSKVKADDIDLAVELRTLWGELGVNLGETLRQAASLQVLSLSLFFSFLAF